MPKSSTISKKANKKSVGISFSPSTIKAIKDYVVGGKISPFVEEAVLKVIREQTLKNYCSRCVYKQGCPLIKLALYDKKNCSFYETKTISHKCKHCSFYDEKTNRCSEIPEQWYKNHTLSKNTHCIFSRFVAK